MIKNNKMKNDENGISSITILIIIIIIGLLLWEIVIPIIDDSLETPSDYFRPSKDEITGNWGIINLATNELFNFPMYNNEIYYESGDVFKAVVYTNAPYSIISKPYYILFEIYESGQKAYTLQIEIPYTSIYTDEFTFDINIDLSGTKQYSVETRILDSELIDMELMPSIIFILPEA